MVKLLWANNVKFIFLRAHNRNGTGQAKIWSSHLFVPGPYSIPISCKLCISGLGGSCGISAGVSFKANNAEMGSYLCLTLNWAHIPPTLAFHTQNTVRDNNQMQSHLRQWIQGQKRMHNPSWKTRKLPTKSHRGYSMYSHLEFSFVLLHITYALWITFRCPLLPFCFPFWLQRSPTKNTKFQQCSHDTVQLQK